MIMTNKDFILELAEQTGYSPEDTQKMVNVIVETMGDTFQEDNMVLVPPKLVLNFKPNANWKEQIKNGGDE